MTVLSNRRFVGLDKWTDPGDLPIGGLTVAKNVYIVGFDCLSRPGLNGLLTTPHAGKAIFFPETFVKPDGTEWVLYCVGTLGASSGGKIYEYQKGASTDTELKDANNGNASFNIAPASFRGIQGGQYFYFITGAAGSLYRTDLSSVNCSAVTGLNPPTGTPSFTLTNQSIDAIASTSGWAGDLFNTNFAYTDLVIGTPNTHVSSVSRPFQQIDVDKTLTITGGTGFTVSTPTVSSVSAGVATLSAGAGTIGSTGGIASIGQPTSGTTLIPTAQTDFNANAGDYSAGTTIGTSWVTVGLSPGIKPANGSVGLPSTYGALVDPNSVTCTDWLTIDDAGEGMSTRVGASALAGVQLAAPNTDRYCAQFNAKCFYYTSDTRSLQGVKFTATAYSDVAATNIVAQSSKTFILAFNGQQPGQTLEWVVDFPNLSAPIKSIILSIVGADANVNAAQFSNFAGFVFIGGVTFAPIDNGLTLTAITGGGFSVMHREPSAAYWGKLGACVITKDYGSNQDWSKYNTVSINLSTASGSTLNLASLEADNLSVVLDFRASGSTTHNYSNPLQFSTNGLSASVDITTVPPAIRAAFEYVAIVFTSDMVVTATTANLFNITSVSSGGNLSVDSFGLGYAPIQYAYEEVNSESDATLVNVLRSAGSLYSTGLQPTLQNAIGLVVIPAFINASADYVAIYRGGGTFTDGQFRLIGTFPKASDVALGADTLAVDQSNPYTSWAHTNRTLTDNTPDSFLNFASLLQYGRDQPPTGATSIAFHQNRVWLGVGQSIWCSWSLVDNNQNGLYFTTVDLTTDPSASIKGQVFPLRAQDGDPIQAMLPVGGQLLVLKGRLAGIVYGYDPTVFALQTFMAGAKLGCVASGAAVICNDTAFFLGPDSVYDFNGDAPGRRSIPIEPLLHPRGFDGGATITPSVFAGSSMMYYDGRLHLFAPVAGGTQNSVDYVYDFRNNVWTSWSIGMTSGASLAGSTDGDLAYMGGYDGQLYTFAAGGDKSTPGATTAVIPWQVVSRGMGQESDAYAPQSGIAFNSLNKVSRIFFAGTFPANTPLVASVWADANQSQWDTSYTSSATAGPSTIEVPTPGGTVGQQIFVSLSGSSVSQSKIRYLGADVERKAATR